MARNRFDEMMRYLHLSDNAELGAGDKFIEVRLLISLLNEKFLLYFTFLKTQHLSIDESMVLYFGKHGAKQFIRGKPICFGYNMWVLTTPLGYVLQLDPYQGARGRQVAYPGLGMGGSVVVDLISELQADAGDSFHLTFDNLFTSLLLVDCLTKKKIGCTGTIRANRIGDCRAPSSSEGNGEDTTRYI
jgi:DNA excision repair protein ERCC-6